MKTQHVATWSLLCLVATACSNTGTDAAHTDTGTSRDTAHLSQSSIATDAATGSTDAAAVSTDNATSSTIDTSSVKTEVHSTDNETEPLTDSSSSASSDTGEGTDLVPDPTDTDYTTPVWQQFIAARQQGTEPILPDFSYAGYHLRETPIPDISGPVFKVDDYGAIPGDQLEDVAGIQAAIDAATAAGGGVVRFSAGQYLINEARPVATGRLTIKGSHIVLRGAGAGPGGTELFMKNNLEATNPNQMWTTPYVINAIGSTSSYAGKTVTTVTRGGQRETFQVQVADPSKLSAGDWVVLWLEDPSAITPDILAPFDIESHWTDFIDGKLGQERKQIAAVNGQTVTFKTPLHQTVDETFNWEIRSIGMGTELGIEDIAFVGNWKQTFVHHKSALHDGGWSAINIGKYANSWLRRLRFVDWNRIINLTAVSATTVQDIIMEGNRGHSSIHVQAGSTEVLVEDVYDNTNNGQWHSAGVSNHAAGNVFLRMHWPATTTFDAHGGVPYATLYDNVQGGLGSAKSGSGGASANLPNHLWNLVLWNWNELGTPADNYRFWRYPESAYYRIYRPLLIGLHGATSSFDKFQVQLNESPGTPVQPASLYEAQLALRQGL